MEIMKVGKELGGKLSKNSVPLALGIGGVILVFALSASKNQSVEMVTPTGYTSYPDAVTNANVIIGEVNSNTRTEVDRAVDAIGAAQDSILDKVTDSHDVLIGRFDDTDNYIKDGMAEILDKTQQNHDTVMGAITDSKGEIIGQITTSEQNIVANNNAQTDVINSNINNQLTVSLNKFQPISNLNPDKVVDAVKNKVQNVFQDMTKYFSPLQKSHPNLAHALKARGLSYSLNARKKIAAANGINNYTGTKKQDNKLLKLWSQGKLQKPV